MSLQNNSLNSVQSAFKKLVNCRKKGGFMIYLNKKFDYDVIMTLNTYDTWEGQIERKI